MHLGKSCVAMGFVLLSCCLGALPQGEAWAQASPKCFSAVVRLDRSTLNRPFVSRGSLADLFAGQLTQTFAQQCGSKSPFPVSLPPGVRESMEKEISQKKEPMKDSFFLGIYCC